MRCVFVETTKSQQALLDEAINLTMGNKLDEAGLLIDKILHKNQPGAIIAGCSEIPLAASKSKLAKSMNMIDCNQVLAMTLVDKYYKSLKKELKSKK